MSERSAGYGSLVPKHERIIHAECIACGQACTNDPYFTDHYSRNMYGSHMFYGSLVDKHVERYG